MLEHKKRFTKKPVNAAPAQSAPAQPAETKKVTKAAKTVKVAEPAKIAPKAKTTPIAAVKPAPKAAAPKPAAMPEAPKPAAPKKVSLPEQTLDFFANLILWVSIAVGALVVIIGIFAALEMKDLNSPIVLVGAIITAVLLVVYPLIIWAFTRVFVNISNTLMKINAKLPDPKEKEEK